MDVFTTAMLGRAWPLCVETFQGVAPAKHLGHEVVGGVESTYSRAECLAFLGCLFWGQ